MNFSFLTKTGLFRGCTSQEAEAMVRCLCAETKQFSKGELIYCAGDTVQAMGLVLCGSVNVENDDLWGNKSILNHLAAGQIFAETYACVPGQPIMVSVVAAEWTEVLFLNTHRILKTCANACPYHSKLIRNLLFVMAQKNLDLSQRIFHTTPKSIRGRLISYLSSLAAQQGGYQITTPFNRQQLADYLSVDRSALSNELSKMQREGLLTVHKNIFILEDTFQSKDTAMNEKK